MNKIAEFSLAAVLAISTGTAVGYAQDTMTGMDTMKQFMDVMNKSMQTMGGMKSTGNPDADFLMMMIPHHQSAIDMAKAELTAGKDKSTRDMAQKIIEAQQAEIKQMTKMLEDMGVKPADN